MWNVLICQLLVIQDSVVSNTALKNTLTWSPLCFSSHLCLLCH